MTKYLKILHNSDIFPKSKIKKPKKYKKRETVKAIVLNKKGEIALVTNPIHKLYLLPGGGSKSTNLELEIVRECLEEINQQVEVLGMVGKTKEFRDRDAKEYTTTCFIARAEKKVKKDSRTNEEIKNGLKVVWVNKKKLKNIFSAQNEKVSNGKVNFYNTAFNIVRDGIFIKEYFNKSMEKEKKGETTIHRMKLDCEPFEKIVSGQKIIESRLCDEKRQLIKVGDSIEFSQNNDERKKVITKVKYLHKYKTFNDLFSAFPVKYFGGTSKKFLIEEIKRFYTNEDEKKYGVVGIELKLNNKSF